MRLLHTADWHLGKIVNEYSMLDDQRKILEKIIQIALQYEVDAIMMAGDIYDRSLPSKEAVSLLNEIIIQMNHNQLPFLAIAGNHDSPNRVAYASELLRVSEIYLAGDLPVKKVSIKEADFYLFPYVDYLVVKELLADESIRSPEDATKALINHLDFNEKQLNIALYHGYVAKGGQQLVESDSERPLTIGTSDLIDASLFEVFDYCALGHLHAPQKVNNQSITYSGSILKYSKSEAYHQKGVYIVDVNKEGNELFKVDLEPVRDLRIIRGCFDELILETSRDYVFIELLDQKMILDAMSRLKKKYPYAMGLEYVNRRIDYDPLDILSRQKIESFDIIDLFEEFYQHHRGRPLDHHQKETIENLLKESKVL